jgi:hypothetical protein
VIVILPSEYLLLYIKSWINWRDLAQELQARRSGVVKMKRLLALLPGFVVFSLVLAVGSLGALSAAGLGTVGGQVLDLKGKVVAAARVTLQDSEGGHLQTTETNMQGRFWFPSLPEGQYSVRASDPGRVSEWRQNVWVSPGRQTDVNLHLRPKNPASRFGNSSKPAHE